MTGSSDLQLVSRIRLDAAPPIDAKVYPQSGKRSVPFLLRSIAKRGIRRSRPPSFLAPDVDYPVRSATKTCNSATAANVAGAVGRTLYNRWS
jgi:hypothetical protein